MERLRRLRETLEIQHYARRHRGTVVVVAIRDAHSLDGIRLDLPATVALGVRLLVVHPPDPEVPLPFPAIAVDPRGADDSALEDAWAAQQVPCLPSEVPFHTACALATRLGAQRLLCLGLSAPPSSRSQIAVAELPASGASHSAPEWLSVRAYAAQAGCAAVLLEAGPGAVFAELFTHHGSGLMIGHAMQEAIREATPADAADLFLLLRDDVARGIIRPLDEREAAATASQHLVYTIDDIVVGTARLVPHGNRAELSRFATLPRYRGRGRARDLGLALIERARSLGFDGVFALSIEPKMWRFFEALGLTAVERASLPSSWRAGYDFNRPSRAYSLTFAAAPAGV